MRPTKEQLQIVNDTINWIFNYCPDLREINEEALYTDEAIAEIIEEEEDIEGIDINFLGEHDPIFETFENFIELAEQIKTIKIINNGLIRTKNNSYYIVSAHDSQDNFSFREYDNVQLQDELITLDVISYSFIVGLVASKLGLYDDDYWGTTSAYQCVQITYKLEDRRLGDKEELDLLNSYLFEIADSSDVTLIRSEIYLPEENYFLLQDENYESLHGLESYNEGMRLFTSAVQIKDSELKFLNFYKVLEHFSPIAVNIEANELMRKKLDSPRTKFEDGDFIRSIFLLANSMRDRYNDKDLIKAAFSMCFDFVGLYEYLPNSIQKKINGHLRVKKLEYDMDKQQLTTASNMAAKAIYKTRNKVVHAKSNFVPDGDEITTEEFEELNQFMKLASSQAIRWYSRQPSHIKQEIIK